MERNRDLLAALVAVLVLTVVYVPLASLGQWRASSLMGHGIGIVGFLLMLATETLYSLRKHSRRMAQWGRMSTWLSAHIFMGIVGPYLVFLHAGWRFAGLAGVTMLLTGVVVVSGFIGRYIYTAVPRTPAGVLVEEAYLRAAIAQAEDKLAAWLRTRPARLQALADRMADPPLSEKGELSSVLGRVWAEWRLRQAWRREVARLDQVSRRQAVALEGIVRRRRTLKRQMASLKVVRRLMSLWHTVHVPLGIALFVAAVCHMVGALYFS